jgi:sirohydrochlorin cobaltochelatase
MPDAKQALLLVGHGSRDRGSVAEYYTFAHALESYLDVRVQPCFLEFADPPIAEGIRVVVEDGGAEDVVAVPLFLGPAGHQKNDVPTIINWAKQHYPGVTFRYGAPIGAHYGIVNTLALRAEDAITQCQSSVSRQDTAVLIVGRGSRDPDSNSEVHKIARLLWEGRDYGWVETCFYALTKPDIAAGMARCRQLGAKRIVVLPYLLFTGRILHRTHQQVEAASAHYPDVQVIIGEHLGSHSDVIAAVAQRYHEARTGVAAMTCDVCKYRHRTAGFEGEFGLSQMSDHHHGMRGVPHHGFQLEEQLGAILPPRYQNDAVSYAPMPGAAGLVYDADGNVAWNQIWEDFCDLALAGGPPHRADLLEPVTADAANAQPKAYEQVLAELERGIGLVTNLPVVQSTVPGWIGMQCDTEDMAVWLLRAIIVENVMVRREETTLFLPAGPAFRIHEEIKNVITVVAKTHHYWLEHIAAQVVANG